jgi:hypothetical protein
MQFIIDEEMERTYMRYIYILWFNLCQTQMGEPVNGGGRVGRLKRNEREKKLFCCFHVKEGTRCRPLVFWGFTL